MRRGRISRLKGGLVAMCLVALLWANMGGCGLPDWCATFRDNANPSFQSAAISFATGLIDGIFALLNTGSDVLNTQSQQTTFTQGDTTSSTTTTP